MLGVLIVDDHPMVREGLRGMLAAEPGITVVGEAESGARAVEAARELRPEVVLMDLRMPGGDGLDAVRRLAGGHRVVVLTTYDGDADIAAAVAAGAAGYLLKDVTRAELAAAVRTAASGGTALSPAVAARLAARRDAPALSAREGEVLALVARGLTNAEVGRRLHIGEATVKTHLLRIFTKLGVSDRTAAVVTAMERGMLPPGGPRAD
ncbi:response regulator transcription factor [Spirillospora sp. NPDC127200]